MGRFGSDVLALSCIAGGAVIATGLTAALLASPSAHAPRAEDSCSSRVVVRVGSAHDDAGDLKVFSTSSACADVRVNVAEMSARMEEVRSRVEEATARAEVLRVEAEKVRWDARTAESRVREVRLEALQEQLAALSERLDVVHEVDAEAPQVEEVLAEAREQLLRQIEELTVTGERGGND